MGFETHVTCDKGCGASVRAGSKARGSGPPFGWVEVEAAMFSNSDGPTQSNGVPQLIRLVPAESGPRYFCPACAPEAKELITMLFAKKQPEGK